MLHYAIAWYLRQREAPTARGLTFMKAIAQAECGLTEAFWFIHNQYAIGYFNFKLQVAIMIDYKTL
jgi:hypothetical protein